MPTLIAILVVSLATYRLTRLITSDLILEGPREWLLVRFPNDDPIYTGLKKSETGFVGKRLDEEWRKPTFLGRLISCDYCLSVWLAVPTYLAWKRWPDAVLCAAVMGVVYLLANRTYGE